MMGGIKIGRFSGLVTSKIILIVLLLTLFITSGCIMELESIKNWYKSPDIPVIENDGDTPAPIIIGGYVNLTPPGMIDPPPKTPEIESAVDDLTSIIIIGDEGGSVAVYKCSSGTDCNRCQDGDVYGQACIDNTCQGSLDLIEDCEDGCRVGECIEKEPTDETQCSPGIEKCPGYERGIGNYSPRTEYPECACE
jgi:hypothetical protein